ncbi:hypothetical protein EON76_06915 [bacterium]|nr:MAG: hypothetical protein EON76_06915 [bacterium]
MNNNSTDEQADASARRSSGYRLLAVGIILSPFIWLLVKALLGSPEDTSGLGKVIGLMLYIIPSLVSIFCIPLGIARLFDASKRTSLQQDNAAKQTDCIQVIFL